jgi:thymidylate synthase (FAD)
VPVGEVVFSGDLAVELIKHAASGADVIWAARVPIRGEQSLEEINADAEPSAWLIGHPARWP